MRALLSSRWTTLGLLCLVIAALPLVFPSGYYYRVAALVWISAIAAVGLNIFMGYAGQVSLGHAGFFGIGAYAVAIGPARFGLNSWLCIFLGVFLSAALAWLVGRPILRLRGHYLAIATLGLGFLIALVLANEARWTGGPDGTAVPRLTIAGARLMEPVTWYWISGGLLTLGTALALNLENSAVGRALRALHDSEIAAALAGIDVARHKLRAFVIAAVYASLAGSALALFDGFITPDAAGFLRSIELVAMVVVGGIGSTAGSIVGAGLLVTLPQILAVFVEYEQIALGLIIMVVMIFLRRGIVPSARRLIVRRAP
ncbi:MAG: branched-chain amino acid ABC transporter permease [Alphaproteobacteria bacterium]|nr:branched-chain amino acid ABC transporter permease [Alphaproteobacteria bacterium]